MERLLVGISKFLAGFIIPLAMISASILVLRIIAQKFGMPAWLRPINLWLHKLHLPVGIMLITVVLLHGLFSPISIFSPSWGVGGLLVLILMGGTYLLRSVLKSHWLILHRLLACIFLVCVILHLTLEVPVWKKAIRNNTLPVQSEIIQINLASK